MKKNKQYTKDIVILLVAILVILFLTLTQQIPLKRAPSVCVDGTLVDQCSTTLPLYCNEGLLTQNSTACGCPSPYYVQDDGTCSNYPHIKLFLYDLKQDLDNQDTIFKAKHYDLAFSHTSYAPLLKQTNPQIRVSLYKNPTAYTDNEQSIDIPNYCLNIGGCTNIEDFYLHYIQDDSYYDVSGTFLNTRGYNPACSPVCNPPATANSLDQSRIPDYWLATWKASNITSPLWFDYETVQILNLLNINGVQREAMFFDNAFFYPPTDLNYDKTHEYLNIPLDSNHPRIQEMYDGINLFKSSLDVYSGRDFKVIANFIHPTWFFNNLYLKKNIQYINDTLLEIWYPYEYYDKINKNIQVSYYELYFATFSVQVLNMSLNYNKTFYLIGAEDYYQSTDRGKEFLLTQFYLINNKNLYFMYKDTSNGQIIQNGRKTIDYAWVNQSEFDIGKPVPNILNKQDVFKKLNTNLPYEYDKPYDPSTNLRPSYIYARDYENALILSKMRGLGGSVLNYTRIIARNHEPYTINAGETLQLMVFYTDHTSTITITFPSSGTFTTKQIANEINIQTTEINASTSDFDPDWTTDDSVSYPDYLVITNNLEGISTGIYVLGGTANTKFVFDQNFRAPSNTLTALPTGKKFYRLLYNNSFFGPITVIDLKNNEGAILVRQEYLDHENFYGNIICNPSVYPSGIFTQVDTPIEFRVHNAIDSGTFISNSLNNFYNYTVQGFSSQDMIDIYIDNVLITSKQITQRGINNINLTTDSPTGCITNSPPGGGSPGSGGGGSPGGGGGSEGIPTIPTINKTQPNVTVQLPIQQNETKNETGLRLPTIFPGEENVKTFIFIGILTLILMALVVIFNSYIIFKNRKKLH
ncbi:MAG TPA: hypothetical protein VJJ23_04095 [Candidatus Nanoarchaeia archaeon]|nr:hypothetical protein [Candidatus Nanoarchaeia archaeon]